MLNRIIIAVLSLALICFAVYSYISAGITDTNSPSGQGGSPSGQQAMEVSVIRLESEKAVVYEELPGRTVAYKVAEIRPQVSGIITERLFEEGSSVNEGSQLYQIDPSIYQAKFNSALADLEKARANVRSTQLKSRRYEKLVKIDAVSKQDYDDIKAALAQANADVAIAEAAVAEAKINLDYTRVYAPISGRIGKSSVTEGALVTAGQSAPLATVTSLDPIYVDMTQSSTDLMRLRKKMENYENIPVDLIMDNDSTGAYNQEGKLQFHEVSVDQTTGSVQLRALFPNPNNILLPGLFVRARLKLEYPDSLLIEQKFTQRDPEGNVTVWIMGDDNTINPATITVKEAVNGKWLITSGLNEGAIIVTEGFMKLQPGMKINPVFNKSPNNDNSGE